MTALTIRELAKLLVKAAEEILKMIPDPEVQGYAIIAQITGKIIDVIPDGLLTNDDDYVDCLLHLDAKHGICGSPWCWW